MRALERRCVANRISFRFIECIVIDDGEAADIANIQVFIWCSVERFLVDALPIMMYCIVSVTTFAAATLHDPHYLEIKKMARRRVSVGPGQKQFNGAFVEIPQ